ncbi:2-octaprenyl-6-methoxyphenyl hydroxylase [Candidatus Symbiopectobacterium sp. NZEC127]|uniref:2-octaprenyl-6-methoxyphenyl hydroxylase n=1 Tax=Candidatus Symbiopectobacterium sp. NZEC127 TaxID=2820472 RepID=UPI002227D187|nr:2-octaprenyl-6-methoxyphenyl hydroxylase [Candidatus Symbiopectobacterium sp. NZEC127]MCW2486419.1 2-octaprenyl-6-methoxyphenyl hydroxylase [Candidatus Symbiopectobacterium sp. NZEC127]
MTILIVGGGMAGATLALAISALSGGTLPVEVIEAHSPLDNAHPGFDARAIALAEGTVQQLKRIGVWQAIASEAEPITSVHVSDRGHAGVVNMQASDYRAAALGYVVELHQVGQTLFRLLHNAPGVRVHCPRKVVQVERSAEQATLQLDDGSTLHGQLLVAADGSSSALARACGIQWETEEYPQFAVIANIRTQLPHAGKAFERFTPDGPLALLPMHGGRSSLVWCHPLSHQTQVADWSEAECRAALQRAFGWRLGAITHIGERHTYPLRLVTAARHIAHRVALVGNAAQTLHPIAGQGFNLGLRDVMSLAETLTQAAAQQEDTGSYRVLSRYGQRREPDQQATIALTDGLVRLFANSFTSLEVGRNLGLMTMNTVAPVRDTFARRTLGWVSR